jgi:hypothetical protein
MTKLENPSGCLCLRRRRRPGMLSWLLLRLRIAYYQRALRDMGLAHPDAFAVLLHLSALRDRLAATT